MERTALIAELKKHAEYLEMVLVLDVAPALEAELREVRAFLAHLNAQANEVPAPAEIAQPDKASAPRCPHYKAIRRAFAICIECGLDTKADRAMRRAFEEFLIRPVPSRDVLDGRDWVDIGDAIKRGELAW